MPLNAAEAMPEGGTVSLSTADDRRSEIPGIELIVSDTGPGVASEVRARIFDPFFTTKSSGSGLGLAVVMRTVEEHGGVIELDEPSGRTEGAPFRILFPILRPPERLAPPRKWKTPLKAVRRILQWQKATEGTENVHAGTAIENTE